MVDRAASVRLTVFLAAVALVVAPSLAAPALAQDPESDGSPAEPATLDFVVDRDGFDYQTRFGDARGQLVNGAFDLESARLNLSYNTSSEGPDGRRSVNLSLALSGVYEFRDVNSNSRFDLGDEVVAFHSLGDSRDADVGEVDADGPIRAAKATYPLEDGGDVEFTAYVSPRLAFLERGRPVQPTDTEIDITFDGVQVESDDTSLGVAMRLESAELEQTDVREISVQGDRAAAVYQWPGTIIVDGELASVRSTVLEQRLERGDDPITQAIVVQAVDPGDEIRTQSAIEIVHTEPTGQEVLAKIVGDPLLFAGGLIAAILVVGGNAWAKLRSDSETLRDA